ncbi:hypothetical protein Aph01nite_16860 [Acrocarpospora phusangensis]|uniref:ATP-grasp domain-containing protein n=1 Tax=Acrocarpospora phusangensis TaxID=1070424 RepID=A0A919Q8A5_9ACTN|nr:hypothetical protein Aph01nite_16860 [Acrocarpospora phusangensis]
MVHDPDAAARAATEAGLPVALKATGPLRKTDIRVGLTTPGQVRDAYREMAERSGPAMTGGIVRRMVAGGVEVVLGGVNYPAFGPLVMVGMGGATADLLADRSFRVPPLTPSTAAEMIADLRCSPLLYGYRNTPRADITALTGQIVNVGRLLDALPEVAELELDPVLAIPHAATTLHARVRIAPAGPRPSPYTRRLR